jgi:hypothetical protein
MYLIKQTNICSQQSWDSAADIATGYGLDDRGVGEGKVIPVQAVEALRVAGG